MTQRGEVKMQIKCEETQNDCRDPDQPSGDSLPRLTDKRSKMATEREKLTPNKQKQTTAGHKVTTKRQK